MKMVLLALLLLSCSASAQTLPTPPAPTETGPPAGQEANTPFPLAETDPAHGRLTTDYRHSDYRRIKVSLRFVISPQASGSRIEERATGQVSIEASRFGVECRGTPKMPIACAWAEMWRLASLYPAGSLAYKRD